MRKVLCLTVSLPGGGVVRAVANAAPDAPPPVRVVPQPSSMVTVPGQVFTLRPTTRIVAPGGAGATGQYLAGPAAAVDGVSAAGDELWAAGDIRLDLGGTVEHW